MNTQHPKGTILVVDDDESSRTTLAHLLASEGFGVTTAVDGLDAVAKSNDMPCDAVVTDLNMPNMDGMSLLAALREKRPGVPVIVMTAMTDTEHAVAAMRAGAEDYITKPVDVATLAVTIERALERCHLRTETDELRRQIRERDSHGMHGLLGVSPAMQKVYGFARNVARSKATVLITGESGTGKSEIAKVIHGLSDRSSKPLVSLHCAAIPETLLEAELFGHERGAFTGAEKKRIGRIEQANGGTLFLDEIGDIPPGMQVKLLRVLQERTIERIGSNDTIQVDIRLIAATNKDLAEEVRQRRFREDLYYRLNVVHVEMPPLRLRGTDVLILAEHFLRKFAFENHKTVDSFTDRAREKILRHTWPGNVRELENAIERAVILCQGTHIDEPDLPFDASPVSGVGIRIPGSTMAELEQHAILKTLEACNGSTTKAAEMLAISVRTIQYRMHQYGLRGSSKRGASDAEEGHEAA